MDSRCGLILIYLTLVPGRIDRNSTRYKSNKKFSSTNQIESVLMKKNKTKFIWIYDREKIPQKTIKNHITAIKVHTMP